MIFKDININELFQLMQKYDIAETTLQNGKSAVMVKRRRDAENITAGEVVIRSQEGISRQVLPEAGAGPPVPGTSAELETLGLEKHQPASEESANGYHRIVAPLVGTFYRALAPDVPPFVEVGDHIEDGDVVCIVEAMKSMNEIQSDVKGVVKEICIENAQLVEFGQVLFKVEPGA